MHLTFTKLSGAGNDFILLDDSPGRLQNLPRAPLARSLCSRPFGIGADGLLILSPSSRADFCMEYYNADGSHGGMCGNGGRCIARYAHEAGLVGPHCTFEALGHIYEAWVTESGARVRMKQPIGLCPVELAKDSVPSRGWFIDTGAPHVVLVVEDARSMNVERIGRAIRNDSQFLPGGVNVDFVQVTGSNSVELRTYERGVEAETFACGTGALAAATVATAEGLVVTPTLVRVRSGETLVVSHQQAEGSLHLDVFLEGSAHILFHGELFYDVAATKIVDYTSTQHPAGVSE